MTFYTETEITCKAHFVFTCCFGNLEEKCKSRKKYVENSLVSLILLKLIKSDK